MAGSGENRGVFDPADTESEPQLLRTGQVAASTRASDYYKPGFLPVVPARGGVQMGGDPPPPPPDGLTEDNLVCTGIWDEAGTSVRPPCDHYIQILTDAEGTYKGGDRQPRQIRRYCRKMSTASELMDLEGMNIYGCSARTPLDQASVRVLADFEQRQREHADEMAAEGGEMDL